MYPMHGDADHRTSPPPFAIKVFPDKYQQGQNITVTLFSLDRSYFRGFLLKATPATNGEGQALGTFVWFQENKTQVFTCEGGYKNTATHTNKVQVQSVVLQWRAPDYNVGDIVFRATVVVDFSTFWTGITEGLKPFTNDHVVPLKTPTRVERKHDQEDLSTCGIQKGCFLYPRHCINSGCEAAATFWLDGDRFQFFLTAKDASYVAVGFSTDKMMGGDETVSCTAGDILSVQHGYNNGHENQRLIQSQLLDLKVSRVNKQISCSFVRPIVTVVSIINQSASSLQTINKTFDLKEDYYMMIAWGHVKKGSDVIAKHQTLPPVTDGKVKFGEHTVYRGSSLSSYARVHVAMMSLVWVLLAGLLLVKPRYIRSLVNSDKLRKINLWLQVHRASTGVITLLTFLGIAIVLSEVKGSPSVQTTHKFLGWTVSFLLLFELFTGFLYPENSLEQPEDMENRLMTALKLLGKVAHRLLGFFTYIIALASMYSGFYVDYIPKAMREYSELVVVVWLTSQVMWVVVFQLAETYTPVLKGRGAENLQRSIQKIDIIILIVYFISLLLGSAFILSTVIVY
ncbi:putative ferric-chelate reductase 1 isoform X2 [Pomacea canaliculata]|nr:putative ferric-chelate reductase 1 isoform X2 [Pomacea canaliculata]